mgnify:CR=1 FL=1|jgi:hypothetical protein
MQNNNYLMKPRKLESLRKQLDEKVRLQEKLNLAKKESFFARLKNILNFK